MDPEAKGIMRTYGHALEAMTASINRGQHGYHVGTLFPPAARDVFVQDLETAWVNEETPEQMLAKAKFRFDYELDSGSG